MNNTLLCDYYELTMANGYFKTGIKDRTVYFDMFFRHIPDNGGYAVFAGLEQLIDYIENLKFTNDDIAFLRSKNLFDDEFLDYLKNFRFSGDIWSVPEGTPVFPNEPLITVRANALEAQFIETYLLNIINHQSLIATKASRICDAAQGREVSEFGARRAHGADAAVLGARAAYIGGCSSTSCTMTDKLYGVPAGGTMAHSWVQMFDDEYTAFKTYCSLYPDSTTLLVDTYDTLKSGVPNAIKAIKEILIPKGAKHYAIRLDSGDIAYLSRKARKMLDEAGLYNCRIVASNALDEYLIRDLIMQGAEIDMFGVGERMITAKSDAVFDGVYKLAAVEQGGEIIPKIKISENHTKITNPHFKSLYRILDNKTGKAIADYICVHDEQPKGELKLFDPIMTWKSKLVSDYTAVNLKKEIIIKGKTVYKKPALPEIKEYCKRQKELIWDEVKRFENPHSYYVDMSQKLWDIKQSLLDKNRGKTERNRL